MDTILKRRLLGAAILLATAFTLAVLLPEPKLQSMSDEDVKVVTVDLDATPAPVEVIRDTPMEVIDPTIAASDADVGYSNEGEAPEIAHQAQEPASEDADAASAAVATPEPTAVATAKPTALPTAKPTVKPTQAPTPLPTVAPPSRPAATAVPAASDAARWWVQIGSYSDISNAREGEARLKALGIPVFIAPIDSPSGILYRVRGGPYSDKAGSEKALAAVLKDGFSDARLVHP
jgi:DedD protein